MGNYLYKLNLYPFKQKILLPVSNEGKAALYPH